MKTPKRKHCDIYKCEKCGGYGITFTADDTTSALYQCTLCGMYSVMEKLPERTRAFRARCIRKNREARLRNKISVLQQRMQFAETCIPDLIEELEKYQRESERAVTSKAVAAIVAGKLFLAPCWRAKKNHDIEGS